MRFTFPAAAMRRGRNVVGVRPVAGAATAWTWCQLEVPAPDARVLHVAPDGDDRADGRTPQRAFRTLARARDAVWFRDACQDCHIVRCHVYDCGSGGIRAGGTDGAKVSARTAEPPARRAAPAVPSAPTAGSSRA